MAYSDMPEKSNDDGEESYSRHVQARTAWFARYAPPFVPPILLSFLYLDQVILDVDPAMIFWRILPVFLAIAVLLARILAPERYRLIMVLYQAFLMSLMAMMCALIVLTMHIPRHTTGVDTGMIVVVLAVFLASPRGPAALALVYAVPFAALLVVVALIPEKGIEPYRYFNILTVVACTSILSFYQERLRKREFMSGQMVVRQNRTLSLLNHSLEQYQKISERDLRMAVHVQSNFFPRTAPSSDEWDVAFYFKPMAGVSGDLYDFYVSDGVLRGITLADVSGHGIASGLITMLAKSIMFRNFMNPPGRRLEEVLKDINGELIAEIRNIEYYISAIILRIDGENVEYVNAGHPDMFLRRSGTWETVTDGAGGSFMKSSFLGLEILSGDFNAHSFSVDRGDCLLLYTDGLLEARDPHDAVYGTARLMDFLASQDPALDAADLVNLLVKDLSAFTRGEKFSDDVTIIVLKRH